MHFIEIRNQIINESKNSIYFQEKRANTINTNVEHQNRTLFEEIASN